MFTLYSIGSSVGFSMHDLRELSGYCINGSNIVGFQVTDFDGPQLREIENLAMDMGANCKDNKPRFQRLSSQLNQKIYAMTTEEPQRDRLFKYINYVMRSANNYVTYLK